MTEKEQSTFTCTVTGNPAPNITWTKDGKTVGTGDTMTLETHRNQSGEYWCSAENGVGLAINASAYLDVQCKCDKTLFYFINIFNTMESFHANRRSAVVTRVFVV